MRHRAVSCNAYAPISAVRHHLRHESLGTLIPRYVTFTWLATFSHLVFSLREMRTLFALSGRLAHQSCSCSELGVKKHKCHFPSNPAWKFCQSNGEYSVGAYVQMCSVLFRVSILDAQPRNTLVRGHKHKRRHKHYRKWQSDSTQDPENP